MSSELTIPLYIFAKAPIPGQVKTRLLPHCSPEQAADIAEILLQATIENCLKNWPGRVVLSTPDSVQHPRLIALTEKFGLRTAMQGPGDLGEKMHHAIASNPPAAIIGADVPLLPRQHFLTAHELLQQGQSSITPSSDGGYSFIALAKPHKALFQNVTWGSSEVWQQTQGNARKHRINLAELPNCDDIDDWQMLLPSAAELPKLKGYLSEDLCSANSST